MFSEPVDPEEVRVLLLKELHMTLMIVFACLFEYPFADFDVIVVLLVQLPDYHEIIENPMDFGTVREKLDQGAYGNLEQFEVCIIISCLA